ncbi:MAG: hypothetical protein E7075_01875 [Bacteroidales bacterium]|nr:hypothetical protein [Bacteroidales bacterium]
MLHKITFIEVIDSKLISEDKLLKFCKDIYHLNQKTGSPTFESEPQSIDEIRGYCTEHFTWGSFSHEEAIKDWCKKFYLHCTPHWTATQCYPSISNAAILQQVSPCF